MFRRNGTAISRICSMRCSPCLVGAAVILFSIYLHGTTSGVESDVRSAATWSLAHGCADTPVEQIA